MKLPQVQYGAVERITQGTDAITQAGVETQQQLAIVNKAGGMFKEAYAAHVAADTRNKLVDYRARLKILADEQTDNANRLLDPQELRAHGIVVDSQEPVKGSVYAAPLFEKKATALRNEIGASVPAMFREKFDAASEDALFQEAGNVFNKAKAWKQDEDVADYVTNNEQLLRAGLWEESRGVSRAAARAGTLSQEQLAKSLRDTDIAEALAPALAAIAGERETPLEEEIEKLTDPEYSGALDPQMRRATVTALEQRRAGLAREFDRVNTENQLQVFGDMEVGVAYATGKDRLNPMHIERAYKGEAITVQQRNQLTMQYWARVKAEEKASQQLVDIDSAMKHGVKLSHSDGDHKKSVDNFTVSRYGTSVDAQKGSPEMRAEFERGNAFVAANTGILSNEGKAYLIGMNRSGEPDKVVQAANFYSQLAQVAPQTLGDVPERDRVQLEVTALMATSGVPAAMAMKYGFEAANRSPEQRAEIKATYMAAIKSDGTDNASSLEKFLQSDNSFDPFFGAPTPSNSKIRAEYDSLVGEFFGQTGDLGISRDMAQARVRETWGRSEINGSPQAIKYAPEIRTGRKTKELREELEAQISGGQYTTISGSVGGAPVLVDPKKVIITSDTRTGKDNRYAIQVIRPDGMLDNVYTLDGRQAYWNPMPEARKAADARKADMLEEAKKKRAAALAPDEENTGGLEP